MAITAKPRVLLIIMILVGFVGVAAYGMTQLATADPQSHVYVGGSSDAPSFGYRACGGESIARLQVFRVDGEARTEIWSVAAAGSNLPRVTKIELGKVPEGFTQSHPLEGAGDARRLSFSIVTSDGFQEGMAFDRSEVRPGSVLWSDGYADGVDLDGVPSSKFGC